MPDRNNFSFMAFSVDADSLISLERLFNETRSDIEDKISKAITEEYEGRIIELNENYESQHELRDMHLADLARRRDQQISSDINRYARIRYLISCADGTSNLERPSASEVLEFPNHARSAIRSLEASIGKHDILRVSLRLEDADGLSNNIRMSISGTEKDIRYYGDQLERWLLERRPWYWFLYRIFAAPTAFGVSLSLLLGIFWISEIIFATYQLGIEFIKENTGFIVFASLICSLGLTFLTTRVVSYLIPPTEFVIGGAIRRKKRRESVMTFALVSVMVALFVGVIASVIANKITQ